jgi:hypothetical protein
MYKYTALIIEPRKHKALHFVINNFLTHLSNEWAVIVFHGNQNIEYVRNIANDLNAKHNNRIIQLINLNVENLNLYTYSDIFLSKPFYNYIPTNTFLVFQTDSMILKENKENIQFFLDYDYVGAPWKNNRVGNGGLSLRKKNKMLEIIDSKGYMRIHEDDYFSYRINPKINYNVPSHEIAKLFAIETVFYDNPFGIHNCWRHLPKEQVDFLLNKYPEIKELAELNK